MSRFLRACRRRPPVYRSGVLFHTPTHARMHARAHRPHVHTRGTRHERDAGKPPRAQGCARQHCTPPPPLPKLELAALPWQQDVSEGEERTRAGEERTGARRTNRRRQSAPDISRSRTTCMCPSIHTQRHPTPQAHTHHQRGAPSPQPPLTTHPHRVRSPGKMRVAWSNNDGMASTDKHITACRGATSKLQHAARAVGSRGPSCCWHTNNPADMLHGC